MPALLPGIEIFTKQEQYMLGNNEVSVLRVDGKSSVPRDELREEEREAIEVGKLLSVDYTLKVNAISADIAARKAKNAIRARHPADMLEVDVTNVDEMSQAGAFSNVGPQAQYLVDLVVDT